MKGCQFGDLREELMLHLGLLVRDMENEQIQRKLFEAENLDLSYMIRQNVKVICNFWQQRRQRFSSGRNRRRDENKRTKVNTNM